MLYSTAVFVTMIALTVTGMAFENALVAAIAAISNTGPAFGLVTPENVDFLRLSESQRVVMAITMVVGRIEVLAVIALFKTDSWPSVSNRTKNTGNERRKAADSPR
jgi:trk system potassium uptake protein TrkH